MFVVLDDLVNDVDVDGEVVADAQDVYNRDGPEPESVVQREDALVQNRRILRAGGPAWCLEVGDGTAIAELFGELLDSSSADVELIGDELGVQAVVNNSVADSVDSIQRYFLSTIQRRIVLAKSFLDTTERVRKTSPIMLPEPLSS